MSKLCFKIWSADRQKKTAVVSPMCDNLLLSVIATASAKLDINGSILVLESDGTVIDEDEVLTSFEKEIFLLLECNEIWFPAYVHAPTSSTSTISLHDTTLHDNSSEPSDADSPEKSPQWSLWNNFEINWQDIPSAAIEKCEKGNKTKALVNLIINAVIDQLRTVKTEIPSKVLKCIARKMGEKYSQIFTDFDDDGCVIGDGIYSTYRKLLDRNNYLNRQNTSQKQSLLGKLNVPLSKRKKVLDSKAGCSDWQPKKHIIDEKEIEDMRLKLKNNIAKTKEEILECLELTYSAQRYFLNTNAPKPPSILEIKDKWPHLLVQDYMFWHFEKLMSFKVTRLTDKMLEKFNIFIKVAINNKLLPGDRLASLETDTRLEENNILKLILEIITNFFKEDIDNLHYIEEV